MEEWDFKNWISEMCDEIKDELDSHSFSELSDVKKVEISRHALLFLEHIKQLPTID